MPLDLIPHLLQGIPVTLEVLALSAAVALPLALSAGIARLSRFWAIRLVARTYVEVFRGTSALVQVFFFFYVLPLYGLNLGPMLAGVLALGLNFGAYGSEVVRASILGVPREQREAGVVLRMSPALILRRIVVPQAFVTMLPPFVNLLIELLKATALVSVITLTELTAQAKIAIQAESGSGAGGTYLLVLVMYFILALPILALGRVLERRVGRGLTLGRPA